MVRKLLAKIFGIKSLEEYKGSCIIKPKYLTKPKWDIWSKYNKIYENVMKYRILLVLLLVFGCISLTGGETNSYQSITKRNAFDLTASLPVLTLPPVSNILSTDIFLTGISRLNGVRKVHLVLKRIGEPNKYVSLVADQKQYNIKLNKILDNSVEITKDGVPTLLSFEKNGLPTIATKAPVKKVLMERSSSRSSRARESSKKEEKKQMKKATKKTGKVSGPNIPPGKPG